MNIKKYYEPLFSALALISVSLSLLDFKYDLLEKGKVYYFVDLSIYIIFFIDYFYRLIISNLKKEFIKNNIPDLIAIIPFSSAFKLFRITKLLKITKLARILKILKLSKSIALILRAYKRIEKFLKTNGLIYSLIFMSVILFLSSFIMSYIENMRFIDALWWSFVTASTVGYGDISPQTGLGRLIASVLMLVGIGTIGMITGTIATYFTNVEKEPASTNETEKFILNSKEFTEKEKKEIINYIKFIKMKREEAEYREKLDKDGDGVACK